jgi:hypothetical protein
VTCRPSWRHRLAGKPTRSKQEPLFGVTGGHSRFAARIIANDAVSRPAINIVLLNLPE